MSLKDTVVQKLIEIDVLIKEVSDKTKRIRDSIERIEIKTKHIKELIDVYKKENN